MVNVFYQIEHEVAANLCALQTRKMVIVSCLVLQIAITTFFRDQQTWNEDINDEEQLPTSLLCGLFRYDLNKYYVCYFDSNQQNNN